jgi:Plasmid pRiA4b ORF-3-like protein
MKRTASGGLALLNRRMRRSAARVLTNVTGREVCFGTSGTSIAGERAAPPDDVGGTTGYLKFLKAIRNPKHPEHESMLIWIGGAFDPEGFRFGGP